MAWILGMAVLTIVVSRMLTKTPKMTATRINHLLHSVAPVAGRGAAVAPLGRAGFCAIGLSPYLHLQVRVRHALLAADLWPPKSLLADVDGDAGRSAGQEGLALEAVQRYLDGHALRHLGEVAAGVVGRGQRAHGARRRRQDARHGAVEGEAAHGVHLDVHALAEMHILDVRLLRV